MGYSITTRYVGPTNYRGSRVIATGPALTNDDSRDGRYTRATVSWDYGAGNHGTAYAGWGDSAANHRRAADAVVAKLRAAGWNVGIAPDDRGASLPREDGSVFVLEYGAGETDDLGIPWGGLTPTEYAAARHARLYPDAR